MHHVITVDNVKCGGCVNTIENALREADGVQTVKVEQATGAVQVETDDSVPREVLAGILTALGYPEKNPA
jgi:copper chaperone